MKLTLKLTFIIAVIYSVCKLNSVFAQLYPNPEFENYTLEMNENSAIANSPMHRKISEDVLKQSAIVFTKNDLKYALWFYKKKLYGIIITGKIPDELRKKSYEKFVSQFGLPGLTYEYGVPHYYWYFYRNNVHYTIEIKQYVIDIHYEISDSGIGPRP